MAESSGKTRKVARKLRAIAERLEHGPPPPPSRLGWMEAVTARWEKILDEQPAQPPAPGPPAGHPSPETGRRDGAPAAAPAAVQIWCDGSCSPNPGAGGWGAIVQTGGGREELSGAAPDTTNNIMEMTAALEALRRTAPGALVEVTTDSQYLKNGITRWIHNWKRRGWKKSDGGAVLNRALWQQLDALVAQRNVRWQWVRGHTGHPENERCDQLANDARLTLG